jgi:AraC family transcriptional regulator
MGSAPRLSYHHLPCGRPGVLVTSPASDRLIAVRSAHEEWPFQSSGLALKAVLEGEREIWVDGERYVLTPGRYLLVPPGPRQESGRTSHPVAMLPVWFSKGTVRSVADTLGAPRDESLLDRKGPGRDPGMALLPRSPALDRAVRRLWRFAHHVETDGMPRDATPALESLLLETLAAAWRASRQGERRLERLSSVRPATRREIVRRLRQAEDLLRGRFRSSLSLSELAEASDMSPYHFLRRFAEYYGTTPHRFLTRLRLSRARRLLADGSRSVKEVAYECGYRSVPSFVHLCVREWGVAPAALR